MPIKTINSNPNLCDNCGLKLRMRKYDLQMIEQPANPNEWSKVNVPCVFCGHISARMAKEKRHGI